MGPMEDESQKSMFTCDADEQNLQPSEVDVPTQ